MVSKQKILAQEEGFIEEMMEGQRVINVFCHQDEVKKDFDVLNEKLRTEASSANKFGNILGPINNNMGNVMLVVIALVGTLLVHFKITNVGFGGIGTITIGLIVSFLSMSKSMTQMHCVNL